MSAMLAAAVLLPLFSTAAVTVFGDRGRTWAGRVGVCSTAVSVVLAVAVAVSVAAGGTVSVGGRRGAGLIFGLYADRLTSLLLLLVLGVSAVVQSFATRYLRGDSRAWWFFAATGVLTAGSAAMATAGSLIGFAAAWTVSGASLCALLATYPHLPAARSGFRRTVLSFVIGDAALWLGVAITTASFGNLDLRFLSTSLRSVGATPTTVSVACLLVVAVLARCAQWPLQGWLPSTLAAPTPVSALLHAGVVNAGGVLLTRLTPITGVSSLATHAAFVAAAATTLYAASVMTTKPDIKGALAHSTMGQMGFMLMACSVGAFGAAIFHLLAHAMYKAALFLGSGGAVARRVRHRRAVPTPGLSARGRQVATASAVALAAVGLLAAGVLIRPHLSGVTGTWPLLIFAFASIAAALSGWLPRHFTPAALAAAALGAFAVSCGYLAAAGAVTSYLRPALHNAAAPVSPWYLVAVAGGLTVLLALITGRRRRELNWVKSMYVAALGAGYINSDRKPGRPTTPSNFPNYPAPALSKELV